MFAVFSVCTVKGEKRQSAGGGCWGRSRKKQMLWHPVLVHSSGTLGNKRIHLKIKIKSSKTNTVFPNSLCRQQSQQRNIELLPTPLKAYTLESRRRLYVDNPPHMLPPHWLEFYMNELKPHCADPHPLKGKNLCIKCVSQGKGGKTNPTFYSSVAMSFGCLPFPCLNGPITSVRDIHVSGFSPMTFSLKKPSVSASPQEAKSTQHSPALYRNGNSTSV